MKIAYFPFFGRNWTITNGNLMVRTRAYIPNPTYDPNDPNSIIGTFSHGWADLGPATIAGAGRSPSRSLATSLSRAPVRLASRSLNACHVLGMQETPLRLPLTHPVIFVFACDKAADHTFSFARPRRNNG